MSPQTRKETHPTPLGLAILLRSNPGQTTSPLADGVQPGRCHGPRPKSLVSQAGEVSASILAGWQETALAGEAGLLLRPTAERLPASWYEILGRILTRGRSAQCRWLWPSSSH